jgi:hypothetical protein
MKTAKLAGVGIVIGLLTAVNAIAQSTPQITMPASFEQVASDHDDYYSVAQSDTSAPPAAKPAAAAPATKADDAGDDSSDDSDKNTCRWCRKGKLADPWTLPQPAFLKDRDITIGGWIEGGIYGNQYGAPSNGPIGLRGIGNGFTVDQVWFYAERKTDTKGAGWDLGGRIDYLFGVDALATQCFGDHTFDYGWNTSSIYGFAMPQVYAEIAHDDVKVKVGHFYTPIGYEVVQAPQNFFYSHSYSHTFGEPFTHTGALASYARNEDVTYYAGWTEGWDQGFEDADGGSTFLGGISSKLSEKTTVAWYVSAGKLGTGNAFPGAASGDIYYNCFILTQKINEKWTYIFEHDLGTNSNVAAVGGVPGVDNQWYQINNYLTYKVNDCWSYGGRFEWFQDPQGARVVPGAMGNYWAMTGGVNYKPHANITIRPEIRYDWFNAFAGSTTLPFNGGTSSSQLSGGFDMIFTY